MTTPYRQPILPGEVGSDVTAVKRAMIKMGAEGSGSLLVSNKAGTSFVKVLNSILRTHHIAADSKYGPKAHALIAPHFDLYGIELYRNAKIRNHTPPAKPLGQEGARDAAKRLLHLHDLGRYTADNLGDLKDLQRTANGDPVWSALGKWIYIDHRPIELVIYLIEEQKFRIGTFAFCSDHHNDGPHGHAGGLAVDISSINGVGIGGAGAHDLTLQVAKAIRNANTPVLRPRQLICEGAGRVRYADIAACCLPYEGFYDRDTLLGHMDHIHSGF